jgi:hypothetical protein
MNYETSGRFFPSITNLAAESGWRRDASSPGSAFLALADIRLSPLKRWSIRFLNPVERIAAILSVYREGLRAEKDGRFTRADFCWRELQRRLTTSWHADLWQAAVEAARRDFKMPECDGAGVRNAFTREIVIETFVAFYGVHASNKGAVGSSRARLHRQYAASILDMTNASPEEMRRTVAPLLENEFQACANGEEWDRGIAVASELVRRFGDIGYEDMLVYAIQSGAIKRMSNAGGETTARGNAEVLRRGITELERVRGFHPSNVMVFRGLATLLHMQAVQLANSGRVSEALVAAEKAAAYNSDEEGIDDTRKTLKELMAQRQEAAQVMLGRIAATPNARLNAAGEALRDDAMKSFAPLNSFVASNEPASISYAADVARGQTLFRRVGLPIPDDDSLADAENRLASGLWEIISSPPATISGISPAWRAVVAERPQLAEYPPETICRYLGRRIFGDEEKPAFVPPEIGVHSSSSHPSVEPFGRWLFSREGVFAKGLLAAAAVVLFWTLVTTMSVRRGAAAHDAAFARVEAAVSTQDDVRTIAASEEFFRTIGSTRDVLREGHVMGHYREAVARSFLRHPGPPDSNAIHRIAEYKKIAHDFPPAEVTP